MVIGAMANTNWRESSEYVSMHWRSAVLVFCCLALVAVLVWRITGRNAFSTIINDKRLVVLSLIVMLVCAVAYASKPWRRLHPAVFWTQWVHSAHKLKASLADQHVERARLLDLAIQAKPGRIQT